MRLCALTGPRTDCNNFVAPQKKNCLDQLQDMLSWSYFRFYLTVLVLFQYVMYVRYWGDRQHAINGNKQPWKTKRVTPQSVTGLWNEQTCTVVQAVILSSIRSVQTAQQLYQLAAFGDFAKSFQINLLKMKHNLLYIRNQSVPRCKHFPPIIKTNQLMMYKAKLAICSQIHTKHSTQSEHHGVFLNVRPGGT
jgi:hypothetical protein